MGFMGAGKTTLGRELMQRLDRPLVDTDLEVEENAGRTIEELWEAEGETAFRVREIDVIARECVSWQPYVLAVGGGAVTVEPVRDILRDRAFTVLVDVDVETAWERARESDRPLARDYDEFRRLYDERQPLYRAVADAVARDADGVVLAAAGVHVERGALDRLGDLVPGQGPVSLVSDPHVAGIHGPAAQVALGPRLVSAHELPAGEEAKTPAAVERLWDELELDRGGTLVALGGGCTTDAAGFAASTYLRGIDWVAVPTTLVGQVDAAIGGKTAVNLGKGKNLAGAFHWPVRTVIDPSLLATLPERERREGMAEVVKTGLLAGEPLWELRDDELVRRCAAFKAAVCLRDPHEHGDRAILNLGHTFAHALEAAAGYGTVSHGRAVALGLLAALRLSGRPTDVVEEVLRPEPVPVDAERAWQALRRDKKRAGERIRIVLLGDTGPETAEVDEEPVRRALAELIAG